MATKAEVKEFLLGMEIEEYQDFMSDVEREKYLAYMKGRKTTKHECDCGDSCGCKPKIEDVTVGSVFAKRGPKGGLVFREVISIDEDSLLCKKLKHDKSDNTFTRTDSESRCEKSEVLKFIRDPKF